MSIYEGYASSEVIDVVDEGEYALLSLDGIRKESVTGIVISYSTYRVRVPSTLLMKVADELEPFEGEDYTYVELSIPDGVLKIGQRDSRYPVVSIIIERAKDHPSGAYSGLEISKKGVPTLVEKLRALARGEPSTGPVELIYPDPTRLK